jgi:hypothetical protein
MSCHRTLRFALVALAAYGVFETRFASRFAQAEDAPRQAATVPTPMPFEDAVDAAARAVLSALPHPQDGKVLEVVIDPLVDGATGARSVATRRMGERIAALAAKDFPFIRIVPFTPETLGRNPILLMGAISALAGAGQVSVAASAPQAPAIPNTPAPPTAAASAPQLPVYALWFTAADLSTRKIIGRGAARALGAEVDPTPDAAYAEAPVWAPDAAVQGYIASCRKAKPGESLNIAYADQLAASATLAQAEDAYRVRNFRRARELFLDAAS